MKSEALMQAQLLKKQRKQATATRKQQLSASERASARKFYRPAARVRPEQLPPRKICEQVTEEILDGAFARCGFPGRRDRGFPATRVPRSVARPGKEIPASWPTSASSRVRMDRGAKQRAAQAALAQRRPSDAHAGMHRQPRPPFPGSWLSCGGGRPRAGDAHLARDNNMKK